MNETDSLIENTVGSLSRDAARRYSRRSFVGKVGRYGIAMTMGWAAMDVLHPATAWAHCNGSCGDCPSGCCGGALSVWCPSGYSSGCPTGSCGCGFWCEPYAACKGVSGSSGWRKVHDCCGGCGGGCSDPGCNAPNCPPTCCRNQEYQNGACNDCATFHIKCRAYVCNGGCG